MIRPGEKAIWLHKRRDWYRHTQRVPVTIVQLGATRVQVEAPLKQGGTKRVWVSPENLLHPVTG